MPFLGSKPIQASSDGNFASSLTIGTGAEEDIMIKFDGNAVDYHIGLDDSTDKLTIGKGSTLGTTTSMTFDENGIILEPLQPMLSAIISTSTLSNIGTSFVNIPFEHELYDRNADYDTSNFVFTAPVDGTYEYQLMMRFDNVDKDASRIALETVMGNTRVDHTTTMPLWAGADPDVYFYFSYYLRDLDAGDTVGPPKIKQSGGTAQMDTTADTTSGPFDHWLNIRLIG